MDLSISSKYFFLDLDFSKYKYPAVHGTKSFHVKPFLELHLACFLSHRLVLGDSDRLDYIHVRYIVFLLLSSFFFF